MTIKVIGNTSGEDIVGPNWTTDPAGENHLRRVLNALGVRMLGEVIPPPPPEEEPPMPDVINELWESVEDPTPRKTPSMYETNTLPKFTPKYQFHVKAIFTNPLSLPATREADRGVMFVQVADGYAKEFWVTVIYKNKTWVKPVEATIPPVSTSPIIGVVSTIIHADGSTEIWDGVKKTT